MPFHTPSRRTKTHHTIWPKNGYPPSIFTSTSFISPPVGFTGTRVPVKTFFDYITTGESIDTYLEDYPYVSREQIQAALKILSKTGVENGKYYTSE